MEVAIADKTVRVVLTAMTAQYQAALAKATATTKAFGATALSTANMQKQAFGQIGLGALALAAGIGFAFKAAADAAMEFESSFAGVRKTVDASEAGFAVLSQGLRDMAKEMPVNVNELNRIAEAAGQLGVEEAAILGFTEVVAKMGVTTNLATDQAANAFARIANIMGTSQGDFDRMGSSIVALGNAGASTESEIVDFALRIAGAGQIAGMTEADILGLSASFLDVGIPAEAGGTAVQKAMLTMTSAVTTGGEQLETFASTAGMSATQFQAAWEADAAGAFLSFIEGLGRQGQQGILTLQELFGVNERVARSFLSVAAGGDKARTSVELSADAWRENNALTEEAAKRFSTTASQAVIMQNRINDAAISFGQIMLPAIAAVVGAIGDFADMIGALPGPVKTGALVMGLLAAAILAVSGATLLLSPRIVALKAQMAQAGIQGGAFMGSLKMAAKAINPLTVGLAAATIVVGAYASGKAAAAQRTAEFTDAVEADTGALGANTNALLVNQLQASGLLGVFEELGAPLDDVIANVIAMAEGDEQAAAATEQLMDSMGADDAITFAGVINALQGGMEGYRLKTEAAGDAAAGAADTTSHWGDVLGGDLNPALEEAVSLTDQLTSALEALAGVALDVEKANLAWLDSLAEMNDELTHQVNKEGELTNALKAGVENLDARTEAGREARQVILGQIDAAIEHGAAIAEETGSVERGARAVRRHISEIMAEAEAAGVSKEAMRDYIAELNLTPAQIKTAVKLLGVPEAQNLIDGFILSNTGRVIHVSIEGSTHGGITHAGGFAGSGYSRRRFHDGGLASDEIPAILQRGEFVINKRSARHLGPGLLHMMNRMHAGGDVPGGSGGLPNDRFLERYFSRLEKALDDAANLIKEAVDDGLSQAHVKTGRELAQRIAERQRHFEHLLEDARDHLKDIRGRMREFVDTVRSGFSDAGETASGLSDAFRNALDAEADLREQIIDLEAQIVDNTDPERLQELREELAGIRSELAAMGSAGLSAAEMQTYLADLLAQNQRLAAAVTTLSDMGLDPDLLSSLAAEGPESLPFLEALVAGGEGMVDAFNATQAAIDAVTRATGEEVGTEAFGEAIERATEHVRRLGERAEEVIEKLQERLVAFMQAVKPDTTAKKFDDLNAALTRLIDSFQGVNGSPGTQGNGTLVPATTGAHAAAAPVVNVTVNGNVVGRNGMRELAMTVRSELLQARPSLGRVGLS